LISWRCSLSIACISRSRSNCWALVIVKMVEAGSATTDGEGGGGSGRSNLEMGSGGCRRWGCRIGGMGLGRTVCHCSIATPSAPATGGCLGRVAGAVGRGGSSKVKLRRGGG
jgi:hypothetical protein